MISAKGNSHCIADTEEALLITTLNVLMDYLIINKYPYLE